MPLVRRAIASIALFALVGWAMPALADDQDTTSPKRALPDYDGRGEEPTHDGAGVWVGRVALSPLYLTSEYLLRRPLGALLIAAEHADVFNKLYDFFFFGPDHKAGILPVGLVEFGFNPSFGLYGFWNDAFFVKGNNLAVHYEFWPDDAWLAGSITDRFNVDDKTYVQLRAASVNRPDQVFYGTGPSSLQSSQSRYKLTSFDAGLQGHSRFWRSSTVEATLGARKVDLSPGEFGGDPSLLQEAATGAFDVPFGFNRGYGGPYSRLEVTLDTRRYGVTTGSSLRIETSVEEGADVEHAPTSGWLRYGAAATATVDLNDHGRKLSLSIASLFADPIGGGGIPFTELVSLGGDKWMFGYFPGRLVDRSAAVLELKYEWPIAPWIDATLHATVGNVFGEHLQGFEAGLLRFSGAFGVSTATNPPIQLVVGFGTEPFDNGGKADSARVTIGVPHSF